jgi:signal transduction histidine kinase
VKLNSAKPKHWLASVLILWPLMALARPTVPPIAPAPAPAPARIVTRYTLISSLGSPDHDPTAWRLLGANDGDATWTLLDVRTNQEFSSRSQRITCRVRHPASFTIYRLQIDARNSATISVDMSVQLAELYLSGPLVNVAKESDLQPVITASCPHPMLGLPENAFDQDPSTKWVDFGLSSSNGCWLQIRYALHSESVVTNISQANLLTHLFAEQDWLADHGPQLLASMADDSIPRRLLAGYALTSANDEPGRDPRDWTLFGSNDGGRTWAVLDARVNQTFTERFQRRVFQLTNAAACQLYRLQIDSIVRNGDAAQLSEIEPLYADQDKDGEYSVVVGCNSDNPPLETAEMAFDRDSRTKWLSAPVDAGHAAWIQWQRVPREESMSVISQAHLERLARSLELAKLLHQASNPDDQNDIPLVRIDGYALTSANDFQDRDPRDWTLEGSHDGGKTWQTLDVRRHEQFPRRHQRREFHLTNSVSCQWVRLQIESVWNPTNVNSMQLGKLELRWADPAAVEKLTPLLRTQGENPPNELAENLFDHNPETKWLDFSGPASTRASWIEWRYAQGGGPPAVDLDRAQTNPSLARKHSSLRLNAVAVFVDTNASTVGLVDQTGFQLFQLSPWPKHLAPGFRVSLSGDLQSKGRALRVSQARLDSIQPLPSLNGAAADLADDTAEPFATATVRGKVEGVFSGLQYSGATVTTSRGPPLSVRVMGRAFPRLPSLECPVAVHGVLERLLNENGEPESAVLWVATPQAIFFPPEPLVRGHAPLGTAVGPPLLTRIPEVRQFIATRTNDDARVRIQGVITYIDLNLGDFYLQNGEDGILIYGQLNAGLSSALSQEGNYVELDAVVHEGVLFATSFTRVLGKGRLPQPARPSWDHLMTGEDDSRWVEVEGIVTAAEKQRLTLSSSGGQLIIWVNELDQKTLRSLSGSLVRVQGVCSPVVNARDQRLGVRLLLPSSDFVEILNPARENPFNAPAVPIAAVMSKDSQNGGLPSQFVKTEGVITCHQPRLLFIQDGAGGLRISLSEDTDLVPGDKVEAVGWPQPDGFSPKLSQAVVRRVGRGMLPKAQPIDLLTNNASDLEQQLDATRVEIEAVLLGQSIDQSVCVLNLQEERSQQVFHAYLPLPNGQQRLPLAVGSHLRLQGVFKTIRDKAPDVGQAATSFEMYLNSPEDIVVTARPNWWTAGHILWLTVALAGVLALVLAWVGLLRNQVRQRTFDLRLKILQHERAEAMLGEEVVERKRLQAEADKAHGELIVVARQAGMAEVAIGVLHNVGNVLNSVNISGSVLADRLRQLKSDRLNQAVGLLREHENDLEAYLSTDAKGKQMMPYLEMLAKHVAIEQAGALEELENLAKNIEHIKDIVAVQQSYATPVGLSEPVQVIELVEDALRMNATSLARHEILTTREYEPQPPTVNADKHKILQILVNLIRNAKQSCDESGRADKQLILRVFNGNGTVKISTSDNGVGIPPENLNRIFNHGFTTRKDGHGFGLHNSALAAKEMGGLLCVSSPGSGQGATFTLELPVAKHDN